MKVKILNVNKNEIKRRLEYIGAKFVSEGIESIKRYDFLPCSFRVYSLLDRCLKGNENSSYRNALLCALKELDDLMTLEEISEFGKLTRHNSLKELYESSDLKLLLSGSMRDLINKISEKVKKCAELRKNHFSTTLAIKQFFSREETEESEIEVSDFKKTDEMLNHLGYIATDFRERYRVLYRFGDVEISVVRLPLIESYVGIKGSLEETVLSCAERLGFSKADMISADTAEIYSLNGVDISDYKHLTFELENG